MHMPITDPARPAIKPAHKSISTYYESRANYAALNVTHETGVRTAFIRLLEDTAKPHDWIVITEQTLRANDGHAIRPDATLLKNALPRGYYEAKDTADDLDAEIRRKIGKGYPLNNTIFEDSRTAVLYQSGKRINHFDLTDAAQLARLLNDFYAYTEPIIASYDSALDKFRVDVPQLAEGLKKIIEESHKTNARFISAFAAFHELCKTALNPNLSTAAVEDMLVQHLLTERLFRKIFENPDFTRRNVIAAEVEKVIDALTSASFSRDAYLRSLDSYYTAIEDGARGLDFSQKQNVLNTVYERFFQGYNRDVADTHGIVYTPQPIVDFMCASVVEVLQTEFGKSLGDPDVVILDPATGTGNFIVNLLRRVPRRDLPAVYRERLFANEIMLLPYYIAALNIEHTYNDLTGGYEAFEGLCFVDTLDLAEGKQMKMDFMTEKNTERVERQKKAPMMVIIGNPPYNVGQQNENDNNKNRTYDEIDRQIRTTYAKDSRSTLKTKLYDPYVRFFRWATSRLQDRDGIVCLVTNNSFVDQNAFDGVRKHFYKAFTRIYHLDLHGNVRQNPKLSGTTHNVFGIQVGVGITIAIKRSTHPDHQLRYFRVPEDWRKDEKLNWIDKAQTVSKVEWKHITPDNFDTWRIPENADTFSQYLPIATKEMKSAKASNIEAIFKTYSLGVSTNRDDTVYDFDKDLLYKRVQQFSDDYNSEVDRFTRAGRPTDVDSFVRYTNIKWSYMLKGKLKHGHDAIPDKSKIRSALYRPFTKLFLYIDDVLVDAPALQPKFFPNVATQQENRLIVLSDIGYRAKTFSTLISNHIPDLHFCATTDGHQCFPYYVYDEDGSNRRENITDWALAQFRAQYADPTISKWDIFYYVYGVLHHPGYRAKFADNLKRELPRIPFAGGNTALTPRPLSRGRGGVRTQANTAARTRIVQRFTPKI